MKTEIFGVKFDNYTIKEAVELALESVNTKKGFVIYTPNPEIVNIARNDKNYKCVLNTGDIVTPDGIGIVYASKILKGNIKERAAGFDIVCGLLDELSNKNGSVYLFGGKSGVAEKAAENIKLKYEGITVAGTQHGYFKDDKDIIADISDKAPDLLLVCLGAPKQELWIYENKDILNAGILIGAGGSIDVIAGNVKRAPKIFIRLGLEWLYRLIKEPKRIGRMMKLPVFMISVIMKRGKDNES